MANGFKEKIDEAEARSVTRDNDIIHRLDIISQRLDNFIGNQK